MYRHRFPILIEAERVVRASSLASVILRPPPVPPEAIHSAVTRESALLERAWALPAAASYRRELAWQSNGSVCGPASLANAFRSLGEPAVVQAVAPHFGQARLLTVQS